MSGHTIFLRENDINAMSKNHHSRVKDISGMQCCGSGSISKRYESGYFYHQAKIVRKTLIPTVL
jgi:hypothetical protein